MASAADVVHLHVVHSYFVDELQIVDDLAQIGTPIVWTMHDSWLMTGRCAQPGRCQEYRSGCQVCLDLKAYQPAKRDYTEKGWQSKRRALENLAGNLDLRLVACADWLRQEAELAGLRSVSVVQNSVDEAFFEASLSASSAPRVNQRPRIAVVCRDLRDRAKLDWEIIRFCRDSDLVELELVGDHFVPELAPGLDALPAIEDRRRLAEYFGGVDALLFTSRVDYFPLTVAEALCSGAHVIAVDSPAAREMSRYGSVKVFGNTNELERSLQELGDPVSQVSVDKSRSIFSPDRMVAAYVSLYRQMVSG